MVRALGLLTLGLIFAGCGSGEAPVETKAAEAKVELSPEQVAYQQGVGKDPNYDPSEAAAQSKKR